jgi:pyrimidine operon attenuation protein/uracil phosphoribosyltransferase
VEATFVGRKVQTTPQEFIKVQLGEVDQTDKVILSEMPA